MSSPHLLLLIQILSCAFMTGLIWTIQLVHYPTFAFVDKNRFRDFHTFHSRKISYLVMPIMVLELVSAVALIYYSNLALLWVSLALLVAIWFFTFFIIVPLHDALAREMNLTIIDRMVLTNWLRTAAWTLRLAVLVFSLISVLNSGNLQITHPR